MPCHGHAALSCILLILLALALIGALMAAFSNGALALIIAVLVLACAKGWLVILDFMEMRGLRGALKPALLAWPAILLTLVCARSVAVGLFF